VPPWVVAGDRIEGTRGGHQRPDAAFIWSVADLLRGDYKQSEYGRVILPMVVLRRLDCVLEPTKDKVLATVARLTGRLENVDPLLRRAADNEQFYNVSPLTMTRLLDHPPHIADNLRSDLQAFSPAARDVLEKFDLPVQIDRLDRADLLYLVVSRFCDSDLYPEAVPKPEMGYHRFSGGSDPARPLHLRRWMLRRCASCRAQGRDLADPHVESQEDGGLQPFASGNREEGARLLADPKFGFLVGTPRGSITTDADLPPQLLRRRRHPSDTPRGLASAFRS